MNVLNFCFSFGESVLTQPNNDEDPYTDPSVPPGPASAPPAQPLPLVMCLAFVWLFTSQFHIHYHVSEVYFCTPFSFKTEFTVDIKVEPNKELI